MGHSGPTIDRCESLQESTDSQGRKLVLLTIAKPDGLESVNGLSEFLVLESQVSEDCTY
jgi:hypothetical protein